MPEQAVTKILETKLKYKVLSKKEQSMRGHMEILELPNTVNKIKKFTKWAQRQNGYDKIQCN